MVKFLSRFVGFVTGSIIGLVVGVFITFAIFEALEHNKSGSIYLGKGYEIRYVETNWTRAWNDGNYHDGYFEFMKHDTTSKTGFVEPPEVLVSGTFFIEDTKPYASISTLKNTDKATVKLIEDKFANKFKR